MPSVPACLHHRGASQIRGKSIVAEQVARQNAKLHCHIRPVQTGVQLLIPSPLLVVHVLGAAP